MTPVDPVASVAPPRSTPIPGWMILLIAVTALALSTAALAVSLVGMSSLRFSGMMSGPGMMGGSQPGGSQPGETGFVAGTSAAPRVVQVTAGPGLAFYPSTIPVVRGETVTFLVTTMGPSTHEFMVGPADAVAADAAGTAEVSDIGMMQTKALTTTFDGPGPYAFACHVPGHYEAGMRGAIAVLPA